MNLLVLMSALRRLDSGDLPLLQDCGGKTQLEAVLEQYEVLVKMGAKPIVTLQQMDCKNFHLDQVVHRFWPQVKIVKVQGETAGAVCSALLAINHLLLSEPLLIVNGDHLLEADLIGMIEETKNRKASGGVVVFESINPRFSYVRIDEHGWVDEVAEKKPISRNATAGVYYYSTAQLFIQSAVSLIKKQAHFGGRYYIAPCFNEVILRGGSVFAFKIPSQSYKPLSPINIPINREAP